MAKTNNKGRTKKRGQMAEAWARMKTQPLAVVSLAIVLIVLFIAVFADVIVPYSKAIEQVAVDLSLIHIFLVIPKLSDLFQSMLSVCECNHTISWESHKIHRVMVLFLKEEDRKILGNIYQMILEL